jgi:fatty-acid desaturase
MLLLLLLAAAAATAAAAAAASCCCRYVVTGMLGVSMSYHRQLSHKSFRTPKVRSCLAVKLIFGALAAARRQAS